MHNKPKKEKKNKLKVIKKLAHNYKTEKSSSSEKLPNLHLKN